MTGDSTTHLERSAVMSGTGIHRLIYRKKCVAATAHNTRPTTAPTLKGQKGEGKGLLHKIGYSDNRVIIVINNDDAILLQNREPLTVLPLAFTQHCDYQYCMVYAIQTRGRRGGRILPNSRVIVLHQGGQCRWARGME